MRYFLLSLLLLTLTAFSPVQSPVKSPVQSPVINGAGVAVVVPALPASTCMKLSSADAASFTSGQTWANIATSAAGCAGSGTDYDFFLGAGSGSSTDDPTFTGSAGDPGAFFLMDGGDFFTIKDDANTEYIDAHQTTDAPAICASRGCW